MIVDSHFRQHVVLGPYVIITHSSAEPFVKVARYVRVEKSLMASHSAIEGSTHPEQIPLGPRKRELGIGIGPYAWLGQHVSVTHGGIVGRGVMVAAHTAVSKRTSDFVFVAGNPPREFPIDFNVRGLSTAEADSEGAQQGMLALHLPAFGPVQGAFATPLRLELDYAEHLHLRGLASENLVHFQRGVLTTAMAQLFPDHRAQISFAIGKSLRFTVELDRALAAQLYVPGPFAVELFRGGGDGGMFVPHATPAFLAQRWQSLLTSDAPLPAHESAATVSATLAPAASAEPAPDVEAIVAALVAQLTERTGPIDPDAPFHTLGMDSVVAVQLAVSVERHFHLVAPDVFRHNSVRKLARAIRDA